MKVKIELETPEEFLIKYGICSDTTIGIEGDKKLTELLEDYHQAKLKLFVIADLQAVEKALSIMSELIQYHSHYCEVEMNEEKSIMYKAVQSLEKISQHFS
jgi:pyridoxine 5'-phosphate synthase PdxJ